jgi:hypothetical protein
MNNIQRFANPASSPCGGLAKASLNSVSSQAGYISDISSVEIACTFDKDIIIDAGLFFNDIQIKS